LSKKEKLYEIATRKRRPLVLDEIDEEIKREDEDLAREARRLRLQEIVERRKKKLEQLKASGQQTKEISRVGTDFLSGIMQVAQVDPARAKEFLGSLTQEDIAKLSMLSAVGKGGGGSIQAMLPFLKSKETSVKDIVTIVKMMQQQPTDKPLSLEGIAALFKVIQEAQGPRGPTSDPYKAAYDLLKPFFDQLAVKDREFYNSQLVAARAQNVDPIQYLMKLKEVAPQIGFVPSSQVGQPNLEIEKLRMQRHEQDLTHDRWKYEREYQQRKDYQEMQNKRASEKERNKLIRDIAVPAIKKLGPTIDAAVKRGTQVVEGGPTSSAVNPKLPPNTFLCPQCLQDGVQSLIDVSNMPDVAKCPTCQKEFPKQEK